MRHMYQSLVEILSPQPKMKPGYGYAEMSWDRDEHMFDLYVRRVGLMMCLIDLTFVRAGKDAPSPLVGGRAQDRIGTLFCDYTPYLKAGHIIRCIQGPIRGTFELRQTPDEVLDAVGIHHLECGIIEVSQALNNVYPVQEPSPHVER